MRKQAILVLIASLTLAWPLAEFFRLPLCGGNSERPLTFSRNTGG